MTEKFASLEHGTRDVPLALVRAVDATFTQLELHCRQTGDTGQGGPSLADMAVTAVQDLRKKGKHVGYLEFLQGMNAAAMALPTKHDCAEIAAAMWTLMDAG